jgi:hypothetical protein
MNTTATLQIRNSTAEFLMFTSQAGEGSIELRVEEGTVWVTQKLIAALFDKSRSTITEHLRHIFDEGEVNEKAVCRNFRHTANDGKAYDSKRRVGCQSTISLIPRGWVNNPPYRVLINVSPIAS